MEAMQGGGLSAPIPPEKIFYIRDAWTRGFKVSDIAASVGVDLGDCFCVLGRLGLQERHVCELEIPPERFPVRRLQKWTGEEKSKLWGMISENLSIGEMCRKLARPYHSVIGQKYRLLKKMAP